MKFKDGDRVIIHKTDDALGVDDWPEAAKDGMRGTVIETALFRACFTLAGGLDEVVEVVLDDLPYPLEGHGWAFAAKTLTLA